MRIQNTIEKKSDGLHLYIKAMPGSPETKLYKLHDNRVVIKIQAAPEKGKANKALIDYLSRLLKIQKKQIEIIHGETSHLKTVRLPNSAGPAMTEYIRSLST